MSMHVYSICPLPPYVFSFWEQVASDITAVTERLIFTTISLDHLQICSPFLNLYIPAEGAESLPMIREIGRMLKYSVSAS